MRCIKSMLLLFLLPLLLLAQEAPHLTPEQIQFQLDDAEQEFQQAKKMFNPWYAGPLLTGGAHMMTPGYLGVQAYIYGTDTYAQFDSHHQSQNIPDTLQLNPQVGLQTGITSLLDIFVGASALFNWQGKHFGWGFGDTSATLGLRVLEEGIWTPAMKIGIGETFPTGSYKGTSNDLSITGGGIYQTTLSYRIAKLFLWNTQHPLNLRATYSYTIPTRASVKGRNAYGGGPSTRGKVRPGNQGTLSVGVEWSFTQNWVFANDFVFVHSRKTKFVGQTTTPVGAPSGEQFSIAPAIEYNPSANLNFITGVWFSLWGRNSPNFISAIFGISYTFKVS